MRQGGIVDACFAGHCAGGDSDFGGLDVSPVSLAVRHSRAKSASGRSCNRVKQSAYAHSAHLPAGTERRPTQLPESALALNDPTPLLTCKVHHPAGTHHIAQRPVRSQGLPRVKHSCLNLFGQCGVKCSVLPGQRQAGNRCVSGGPVDAGVFNRRGGLVHKGLQLQVPVQVLLFQATGELGIPAVGALATGAPFDSAGTKRTRTA